VPLLNVVILGSSLPDMEGITMLKLLREWSGVPVVVPVAVMRRRRKFTPGTVAIMTWGGLRGGISVALALSLAAGREREIVLAVTYIVVIFSILAQGLKRIVRRLVKR
jgi:CPA1 family monovalent cation:H+ antiporter